MAELSLSFENVVILFKYYIDKGLKTKLLLIISHKCRALKAPLISFANVQHMCGQLIERLSAFTITFLLHFYGNNLEMAFCTGL